MPNLLRANWELVRLTESALRHGSEGLSSLPQMVVKLCETGAWQSFQLPGGEEVAHKSFADFIIANPPRGLGTSADVLDRAISHDQIARDAVNEQLRKDGKPGRRTDLFDNIQEVKAPTGTSNPAALRRLRKDAPELHAQVLAGRLSAHGAMVQAGYRPKTVTVPVTRPEAVARSLLKHMSADDIAKLIAVLIGAADLSANRGDGTT